MEALKASLAKRGASTDEKKPARSGAARRPRPRRPSRRRRPAARASSYRFAMKSYTTRDVARLLGLSEAQVRSHARVGYLAPDRGPRNAYRFSFQDLVLLRTAKALGEARIAPRRIRRALRALTRELPAGRSLSGVRHLVEGDRVVVRDGRDAWQPGVGAAPARLRRRASWPARRPGGPAAGHRARRSDEPLTAEQWYDLGLDLETRGAGRRARRVRARARARPAARRGAGQSRPPAPGRAAARPRP